MNNGDTAVDPLTRLTAAQTEAARKLLQESARSYNLFIAKSLGGIRNRKDASSRRTIGAFRYHSWKDWRPGIIESQETEVTGELTVLKDQVAMDGLVWLQIGNEQRVVSSKALRELADIADRADSTKPETWVSE